MYDLAYQRASSLDDAKSKFGEAEDARYLAGGMTLLPTLKFRLDKPSDVIDLQDLSDLVGVSESGGNIIIKAMTPHDSVNKSDTAAKIPALAYLAGTIGDPMVRNRGTIGGSLANNDPAASYPSAVVALNATIKTDSREIAADDFFQGMFDTALEEGELITEISFPIPEASGYRHFPNPASRYPIAGVFVAKFAEGARVGVTGAGPCVFRVSEMEAALSSNWSPDAVADIKISDDELNEDIHASPEYRAHLVTVMAKRAVEASNG